MNVMLSENEFLPEVVKTSTNDATIKKGGRNEQQKVIIYDTSPVHRT